MHHTVLYDASVAQNVLIQIAALTDQIAQIRDNAIIAPPRLNKIAQIIGFGVNLVRAQIQLPSTRRFGNYEISPFANAFAAGGAQTPFLDLRSDPFVVEEGEEIPVFANQNSAGVQREYIALLLSDNPQPLDVANRITVRATGSTTLVADTWTPVTLAFDVQLPRGVFKLVGMRAQSATGVAFRCINQQMSFRPGGFVCQSALALDFPGQRRGGLGVWFEFDYLTPPIVEMVATAGDAAETFFLDLIPV